MLRVRAFDLKRNLRQSVNLRCVMQTLTRPRNENVAKRIRRTPLTLLTDMQKSPVEEQKELLAPATPAVAKNTMPTATTTRTARLLRLERRQCWLIDRSSIRA